MTEIPGEVVAAPPIRVSDVPARRGASWIAEGFNIWRGQPLTWTGLAVGWLVMTFGMLMVPVLGMMAAYFLQPVFFASFALAADKQLRGERLEMGDLFLGFKAPVRSLVNVGAILLFVELTTVLLLVLLGLPTGSTGKGETPNLMELARQLEGKEWILVVGFSITATAKGLLWFAPPLIAFHGMKTTHAIRWSVYAALSNVGAMLTYGFAMSLVVLAAMIPWGLGLLVAIPVMLCSTYTGYRDVFRDKN